MAELPWFVEDYVRRAVKDMRRGMRIKFLMSEEEIIRMILEQVEMEES